MPVFDLTPLDNNEINQNVIIQPSTPNSCPNCNTIITCGCQWVIASDGRKVCDECQDAYEQTLKEKLDN